MIVWLCRGAAHRSDMNGMNKIGCVNILTVSETFISPFPFFVIDLYTIVLSRLLKE